MLFRFFNMNTAGAFSVFLIWTQQGPSRLFNMNIAGAFFTFWLWTQQGLHPSPGPFRHLLYEHSRKGPFRLFRYEHSRGFFHFFVMNTAGAFFTFSSWTQQGPFPFFRYEHSRGLFVFFVMNTAGAFSSPVVYEHSRGQH